MPTDHPELQKVLERVDALEEESKKNAERFDTIMKSIDRLVVAVSGDPQNDILGVVGRMRIIDTQMLELQRKQLQMETELTAAKTEITALRATTTTNAAAVGEWNAIKQQLAGASKVGKVVWLVIGAGGATVLYKLLSLFMS